MRIALVAASEQVVGGAENYVRWALGALHKQGHELGFAFEYPAPDPARAISTPEEVKRWDLSRLGAAHFYTELDRFAPDVVFLQGLDNPRLECGLIERYTSVLFAHAYWGTCLTGSRTHAFPKAELCTRRFGPACIGENYARRCGMLNPRRLLRQYGEQAHRLRHASGLAALVVASRHMRDVFEQHGVEREKIHVLPCPPSGIEPDPEPPKPRALSHELLFLGRLTESKGAPHAVIATARASSMLGRKLRLVVAGDGPTAAECRKIAQRFGVDLEMLGWVDGPRRIELLRRADALVVPSLWPEPFGMVGLEGACVGLPSVAYDVGGVREWLVPGESGELARPFEVDELAHALVRLFDSESRHHELRIGAWKKARTMTPEAHLAGLLSVFERAMMVAGSDKKD